MYIYIYIAESHSHALLFFFFPTQENKKGLYLRHSAHLREIILLVHLF